MDRLVLIVFQVVFLFQINVVDPYNSPTSPLLHIIRRLVKRFSEAACNIPHINATKNKNRNVTQTSNNINKQHDYITKAQQMVKYTLTDKEREIIKEYLNTGKKLQDFRVIAHRAKKLNLDTAKNDLELIKLFLNKINNL
jgi:hypothetical protein